MHDAKCKIKHPQHKAVLWVFLLLGKWGYLAIALAKAICAPPLGWSNSILST